MNLKKGLWVDYSFVILFRQSTLIMVSNVLRICSSKVAIIVPIHAVISLSTVQGIQHVYPYRLFRSFVYNIFAFNEISCLRCIYLYWQRVCNAQYGPQLYVNSCWQRAEICRDPHQDCFRTKHRFIATYQPSNYCLFSCVAARCAYLVAKLPLIISSCHLRRRSLTVRSWNRDVSSDAWHHINPSLFPKPIRGGNFRIFFLSCVWFSNDLEESDASWAQTRQSPNSTSKWSWEKENGNGLDNSVPAAAVFVAPSGHCHTAQFILPWWDAQRMCLLGEFNAKICSEPNHSFDIPNSKWSRVILLWANVWVRWFIPRVAVVLRRRIYLL